MSRIYISSSWRNGSQPSLVRELRKRGHQVYDFRHPNGRNDANVWEEVTLDLGIRKKYNSHVLTPEQFSRMLAHRKAVNRFIEHFNAMRDADTCVMILPCGHSSNSEAGIMKGWGKRVFILDTRQYAEPELMYRMYDGYTYDVEDIYRWAAEPVPGICRVCGCTQYNPCYHPEHGNCFWADDTFTLCSHCASVEEGGLGIKDDPRTKHCINDSGDAFV